MNNFNYKSFERLFDLLNLSVAATLLYIVIVVIK
jgi:hypothetical protein